MTHHDAERRPPPPRQAPRAPRGLTTQLPAAHAATPPAVHAPRPQAIARHDPLGRTLARAVLQRNILHDALGIVSESSLQSSLEILNSDIELLQDEVEELKTQVGSMGFEQEAAKMPPGRFVL